MSLLSICIVQYIRQVPSLSVACNSRYCAPVRIICSALYRRHVRRIQAHFIRVSAQLLLKLTRHSPDNVKEFIFISKGQASLTLRDVTERLSLNVGKKNYQSTLRNISEERMPHLQGAGSLKMHIYFNC